MARGRPQPQPRGEGGGACGHEAAKPAFSHFCRGYISMPPFCPQTTQRTSSHKHGPDYKTTLRSLTATAKGLA